MSGKSKDELKQLNGNGKAALHLCIDHDRVCCFLSVGNWHMNPCGAEGKDWRYSSPKSVLLWSESSRGQTAAHIFKNAKCLSEMLNIKLYNETGI